MTVPAEALDLIARSRTVLLASHIPMDGDGLGCALALERALVGLGKSCRVVTEAALPRSYGFLQGYDRVLLLRRQDAVPKADLVIGMDAGGMDRLGRLAAERGSAKLLNIDHHVSNARFGDVDWIDLEAAATGEMIHALLRALKIPLDPGMAQCLLVALVTDTGRFCYSNTTPRTLEIAADLLRLGAVPDAINMHLFRSVPRAVLALQSRAVERMRFHAGGRLVSLVTAPGFGTDLGVGDEEVKDLIDLLVSIEGVVVATLFRGLPEGGCKVSLRSNADRADVSRFASLRGGGGHVRAAGFSSALAPEAAERASLEDLVRLVS